MTIALICMVLFDMLVTKNTGGCSLTQVTSKRRTRLISHSSLLMIRFRKSLYPVPFDLVIENVVIIGLSHLFGKSYHSGYILLVPFLLF